MRKILNMIGLCARAGGLETGLGASEQAVKRGAKLALIDGGASDLSKKAIVDACKFAGARSEELPEGTLGEAIGRPGRMAAAVTDKGFADRISELIDQQRELRGCM